jgi:hypothetical protein
MKRLIPSHHSQRRTEPLLRLPPTIHHLQVVNTTTPIHQDLSQDHHHSHLNLLPLLLHLRAPTVHILLVTVEVLFQEYFKHLLSLYDLLMHLVQQWDHLLHLPLPRPLIIVSAMVATESESVTVTAATEPSLLHLRLATTVATGLVVLVAVVVASAEVMDLDCHPPLRHLTEEEEVTGRIEAEDL